MANTANTASDLLADANACVADEDYEKAQSLYNEVLAQEPNNERALMFRAANSIKLKHWTQARDDAEKALTITESEVAHFRRGVALFNMDEFATALEAFEKSRGQKNVDVWIRKCRVEIEHAANVSKSGTSSKPINTATVAAVTLAQKVTQTFYQSPTFVVVTTFAKNLKPDNVVTKLDDQTLTLDVTLPDGSVYNRTIHLFGPVEKTVENKVTPYKIETTLMKAEPLEWDDLETKRTEFAPKKRSNIVEKKSLPSAWVTKKPIDFTELEQSAKKMEEDEKPEGEGALQKLFQQIYKDADEDTRRAMIKSFQTSGGTVLSTNWKEVKEADYEKDRRGPGDTKMKSWEEVQRYGS